MGKSRALSSRGFALFAADLVQPPPFWISGTLASRLGPTMPPPTEHQLRIDLAACYRLVAHFGWDDLVFTHISSRLPGPENHFLINPYGILAGVKQNLGIVTKGLGGNIAWPALLRKARKRDPSFEH